MEGALMKRNKMPIPFVCVTYPFHSLKWHTFGINKLAAVKGITFLLFEGLAFEPFLCESLFKKRCVFEFKKDHIKERNPSSLDKLNG